MDAKPPILENVEIKTETEEKTEKPVSFDDELKESLNFDKVEGSKPKRKYKPRKKKNQEKNNEENHRRASIEPSEDDLDSEEPPMTETEARLSAEAEVSLYEVISSVLTGEGFGENRQALIDLDTKRIMAEGRPLINPSQAFYSALGLAAFQNAKNAIEKHNESIIDKFVGWVKKKTGKNKPVIIENEGA